MVVVHMIDSNNEQQSVNAWKEQEQLFYYYYCVCLLVLYRYHTHAYTVILRVNAPPPRPDFSSSKTLEQRRCQYHQNDKHSLFPDTALNEIVTLSGTDIILAACGDISSSKSRSEGDGGGRLYSFPLRRG